MSDRWEYAIFPVHHGMGNYLPSPMDHLAKSVEEWVLALNALGQQGWEAVGPVQTTPVDDNNMHRECVPVQFLLLKRKVSA
ncbi:hypothetical protein AB0B66_05790 [Catellatospora sp. NPDC049111]|uniref:hypothetical protein n=1 Tax=Catellatospora sp. NPDC049111 TaxID=3155271 RepID=UPI0033CECBB1